MQGKHQNKTCLVERAVGICARYAATVCSLAEKKHTAQCGKPRKKHHQVKVLSLGSGQCVTGGGADR